MLTFIKNLFRSDNKLTSFVAEALPTKINAARLERQIKQEAEARAAAERARTIDMNHFMADMCESGDFGTLGGKTDRGTVYVKWCPKHNTDVITLVHPDGQIANQEWYADRLAAKNSLNGAKMWLGVR